MGLLDKLQAGPQAMHGGMVVYRDRVTRGRESHSLEGVRASVERGSDLQKRVTATRLVALGVFALAAKKKSGGEVYLTVEGPGFFWTHEVDRKQEKQARTFAARVNDLAAKVG